jgi:hypothetical protein
MESCEICGFAWESVAEAEIAARMTRGATSIASILRDHAAIAGRRPEPMRWSILEYAAHVRDVLLHVRDRLIIGLIEDNPEFKPLYRDQRVDLGLYAADTVAVVGAELPMAAELFARTLAAVNTEQFDRPCQYVYPSPATRSLRWMCQQVVHEIEHHLGDIEVNIENLS